MSMISYTNHGPNSFSEKIPLDKFRLFFDLDFHPEKFECNLDVDGIKSLMVKLLAFLDTSVKEHFGFHGTPEQVVAARNFYKFHVHYPWIIVSRTQAREAAEYFLQRFKDAEEFRGIYQDKTVDLTVSSQVSV